MELTEIEAFIRIAESGTFTRAAQSLGISQPAISRRIDLLEGDLGTPVFERLRTGVRLTDAGRAFLPYAEGVLANLRDGITAVSDLAGSGGGSITLAIVGTLASTTLMERLRSFRHRFPDVRVILRTANSNGVSQLVRKGDADLGLRYFDDVAPGLDAIEVDRERLVIAHAPDSRFVTTSVSSASDLAGATWVTFPVGSGSSGEPFAKLLDRLAPGSSERIQIDSLTAQKRMIETDFGVGIVPESAIVEEQRLGSIKVLNLAGFDESVPIFMVRRTNGYMNNVLHQLVEAISRHGPGT
jgi:DNA-binding transcriptional LysR family regulator